MYSSSSSNRLIWDRASTAPPAVSSSSSDLLRWTTSISCSLVLLTLLLHCDNRQPYSETAKRFYEYCRTLVRNCFQQSARDETGPPAAARAVARSRDEADDLRLITHQGSCHCAAVAFHVVAPRTLPVQEGTGKIPYPRTLVKAKNFKLRQGQEALQTYHVGTSSTAAHTFCRNCGVHLLYAPSPTSKTIYLNVDCLQLGWKRRTIPSMGDDGDGSSKAGFGDQEVDFRRCYDYSEEQWTAWEPFGNITSSTTNTRGHFHSPIMPNTRKNHQLALDIVSEEPQQRHLRETSPQNNTQNNQHVQQPHPLSFAVAAVAREHSRNSSSRRRNTPPPKPARFRTANTPLMEYHDDVHDDDDDDDISEPTIPPELNTSNDVISVGDCSARSYLTEATAKSLRRFMSKHLRQSSTSPQHYHGASANTPTTTTMTASSPSYGENEEEEEDEEDVYIHPTVTG